MNHNAAGWETTPQHTRPAAFLGMNLGTNEGNYESD